MNKRENNTDLESSLETKETPRNSTSGVRILYLSPSGIVETQPPSYAERAEWVRDNHDPN